MSVFITVPSCAMPDVRNSCASLESGDKLRYSGRHDETRPIPPRALKSLTIAPTQSKELR